MFNERIETKQRKLSSTIIIENNSKLDEYSKEAVLN